MQNISCLLIPLVMLIIIRNVRITSSNLLSVNEYDTNYKSNLQSPSNARDTELLTEENDWRNLYKLVNEKIIAISQQGLVTDIVAHNTDNKFPIYNNQDENTLPQIFDKYVKLIGGNAGSKECERDFEKRKVQNKNKRGLTMLSRWKPFRIPISPSGNGRHVIRSPIIPGADATTFNGKLQFMGRPFRWG